MWVYEVAILISDCPSTVQGMLLCGNYESMQSMKVRQPTADLSCLSVCMATIVL